MGNCTICTRWGPNPSSLGFMVIISHKVNGFYKPTYKSGPHLVSISDTLCILEGFPIAIYVDSKVFLPFLGLHPGEMMRALWQPGNGGFTIFHLLICICICVFCLVVCNMNVMIFHILGISSSQLTNSYFPEG